MPFGMKIAPATFQRMVNKLVQEIDICIDNWSDHVCQIQRFFQIMREANYNEPNIKRVRQNYCKILRPHCRSRAGKTLRRKNKPIAKFPITTSQKELARFLDMAGYYRNFCLNFLEIAAPLTNLLSKRVKFAWTVSPILFLGSALGPHPT